MPERRKVVAIRILLAVLVLIAGTGYALSRGVALPGALASSVLSLVLLGALFIPGAERWRQALAAAALVLPVIAFEITSAAIGEADGTLAFAEVGSQILVVLLLALAIDARFFRLRSGVDRLDVVTILFTLLLLGVGEYYSLKSVFTEIPRHAEMVAGAIAAGFTAVSVSALTGPRSGEKG